MPDFGIDEVTKGRWDCKPPVEERLKPAPVLLVEFTAPYRAYGSRKEAGHVMRPFRAVRTSPDTVLVEVSHGVDALGIPIWEIYRGPLGFVLSALLKALGK